ncbi:MAG: DUF2264 domain-containing protein [Colwellia sp.]
MFIRNIVLVVIIVLTFSVQAAQTVPQKNKDSIFHIVNPDYELSPHTGMTKQHWKDAALYMLEGAFSYVDNIDSPMKFPKLPGKSYPRESRQIPTEKLEGLCRTLFVAAPLLMDNPDLVINNIPVAKYYRHQIAKLIDINSESYIVPRAKGGGINQNLVEFGALAISLTIAPDTLWQPLSQAQKDALAHTMISYGDGPTVPSNWKFFNIFVLSFFKDQGYAVNEKLLSTYLEKSLEHYRGDGWYNDNPAYDYYSMWAFQMYGMLWSEYYGKKFYSEYANKFKNNFSDVKSNYPYMFSRNGEMIMWGRSISYRFGAIIPFPLMGFENSGEQSKTNFGWMRRISSGVLKQFLQHPNFMQDNIPTLGFYGHFEPAIQAYSCRGSAYWMGKAFLGLLIPDDNPFWQATENEGAWEDELTRNKVHHKYQKDSQILISDYPNIGAAELRSWSNVPIVNAWEKFRGSENYNRLSYNSAFPWQADGESGEVAMNYMFKNHQYQWEALRMFTFNKYEQGIYYRNAVLETNQNIKMQLADIPLANGILRIDRVTSDKVNDKKIDLHLGHYALPQLGDKRIISSTRKVGQHTATIIDNGQYQLAMVPIQGWSEVQIVEAKNLHPESMYSTVINVIDTFRQNAKSKNKLYITLMLWKKSGKAWTDDELMPVNSIDYKNLNSDKFKNIVVKLKNNDTKIVSY